MKTGILTFHNTPNYGATLQCYALSRFLQSIGHDVCVINYTPVRPQLQYLRFLFLGKRRGWENLHRLKAFRSFRDQRLKMSGRPANSRSSLPPHAHGLDLAITGSDEVWKVDHMRSLDPSYYLDFVDDRKTRIASYAASAPATSDLVRHSKVVGPLLARFHAIAVRDSHTATMVETLTGRRTERVVDPTFLWDWSREDLSPIEASPYIAVYAWLSARQMAAVREFARRHTLRVVCVGCKHPRADANHLAIGPAEWLRLMKHAAAVLTDFFHGAAFSVLFDRPLYAFVDPGKRRKQVELLESVDRIHLLHESVDTIAEARLADLQMGTAPDRLPNAAAIGHSKAFLDAMNRSLSARVA